MESSNIGMAQIADRLGTERQKAWLKKMGFLDRVEVELKERAAPSHLDRAGAPLKR